MKRPWYEYLWIASPVYLTLGFVNILFAWLGLVFFCTPLIVSVITGNKGYCHRYCDRGQLFALLGESSVSPGRSPCPGGWCPSGSAMGSWPSL